MVQKRFYVYNTILILSSILFIIICLILIDRVNQDFPRHMGVNNYIRDNIKAHPIQDLTLSRDGDCPEGFEIELLATWPGTNSGCIDNDSGIVTSKCDTIEIDEISSKTITHWSGYQFCVKRNSNFLFGYQISCPANYQKCSSSLCVGNEENCPITSIGLQNATDSTPNSTFLRYGFTTYLKFVRSLNAPPIVDIQASFYGLPCYAETWQPEGAKVYPLIETKIGCGIYGQDNTADVIEIVKENVLYNNNGFDDVFAHLEGYKDYVRPNNVYLVGRRKLTLNDNANCYTGINDFDIGKSIDEIKSVRTRLIYILILEAIAILTLGTMIYRSKVNPNHATLFSDWKIVLILDFIGLYGIAFAIFAFLYPSIRDSCNLFINNELIFNVFVKYQCFSPSILIDASSRYEDYLATIVRPVKTLFNLILFSMIVRLGLVFIIGATTETYRLAKRKRVKKINTEESEPIYGDDPPMRSRTELNNIQGGENDLNDVL